MSKRLILLGGMVALSCGRPYVQEEVRPKETEKPVTSDEIRHFLEKPGELGEVFRIYADANQYIVTQLSYQENIQLKSDEAGNKQVSEELSRYNMVDYFAEGLLKVELFPNTGNFYRVRQLRPSGVVEIDKIISEDITRWQFIFPKGEINPREFKVRYGVKLEKKISRHEAVDILKKHTR
ncbi:MAG: hypothetical protein NZM25_05195 [Leptospiraceae bacterium]|nr:hypothetical protein [Leptospiraceae bacterium]MDW8305596.1 hypothetical protein [Leptospiraceae bacterium]